MTLDETFRALIREEVRAALREELHPPLLTPADAGKLVGRSAKTVLTWVREGKLQRHGPGPRPLVSRAELLALAEAPRAARTSRAEKAPSAEAEIHRLTRRHG
jgi:Helix-turn-helix domain